MRQHLENIEGLLVHFVAAFRVVIDDVLLGLDVLLRV
jgi:hypothetical protein